ncbi:hypothetical protein [Endothiovibrio diazotrophicus]
MSGALLLPLRPSRWLTGGALLLSLLLFLALFVAQLPLSVRLLLLPVAAAASLHWVVSHGLRRGPFALTAVEWLGEGRWRLTDGRGKRLAARRLAGGVVHHRWVAVPFAAGRRRYSLLLTADAVEAEALRRLRVRLLAE